MNSTDLFYCGAYVEILPTENVRSKEYAGCCGIVINIPIYPSTWYTVKLIEPPDIIIKLQPPSMRPIIDKFYIGEQGNLHIFHELH